MVNFLDLDCHSLVVPDPKKVGLGKLNTKNIPYSYKFSRDIYFADATNSAFS